MTSPKHSETATGAKEQLPASFLVQLADGLARLPGKDGDTVLMGGDPLRLLRLSPRSLNVVDRLAAGSTLAETASGAGIGFGAVERLARRLLDGGIAHPRLDPGRSATHDVHDITFVVPVHNRPVELARLLASIRAEFDGPIVVVDDGSTVRLSAATDPHRVDVVRNSTPTGPAAARNCGLEHVHTRLVAFVDSDCVLPSGWHASWMTALQHFDDASVAVLAPRIAPLPQASHRDQISHNLHAYESVRSPLDLGPSPAAVRPTTRVAYVPAAALICDTDALRSAHGFDSMLRTGEDVDLVWRLHNAGHIVRFEPSISVQHDHRTSIRDFVKTRMHYNESAAALDQRHPNNVPPIVLSPWSAGVWALLATQRKLGVIGAAALAGYSAAAFPKKLGVVREPIPLALQLVSRGHWTAGRQLANATWRTYLPIAIAASLFSKRSRRWLAFSALLHNGLDYRDRRPALPFWRYLALRLLDDSAACAGVWRGAIKRNNIRPLLPRFVNWPGKRGVSDVDR